MNNKNYKMMAKWRIILGLAFIVVMSAAIYSCNDDIDSGAYFTTDALTLIETLEAQPESYSEYVELLQKAEYYNALKSYGSYTCFVPTNSAIESYVMEKWGVSSVSELSTDEQIVALQTIVKFHTLPTKKWTSSFEEGRLTDTTFSGDYLTTSFLAGGGIANVLINRESELVDYDIEADNGIIHSIDQVLEPFVDGVSTVMENAGTHTIFVEAMIQTGYYDVANQLTTKYTVLGESDSVYAISGIYSFDDLVASKSPDDSDYENEDNPLNEFIGYHITEGFYYSSDFSSGYVTTEAEGEAIKIEKSTTLLKINETETGENDTYISLVTSASNYPAKNGVYHTVDTIMDIFTPLASYIIWDPIVESSEYADGSVSKLEKVYPDAFSDIYWYPETVTNRWNKKSSYVNYNYVIFDLGGAVYYEFITPVIPKGQYDFLVCANGGNSARGQFQFYWDGEPIGSVYDLSTKGANIGHPDSTEMEANGWRHGLSWITNASGATQYDSESTMRFHITDELLCPVQGQHTIKMLVVKSGVVHWIILNGFP
jgi:uncharacterized surface protein with fasciclin (FAS1) repeats